MHLLSKKLENHKKSNDADLLRMKLGGGSGNTEIFLIGDWARIAIDSSCRMSIAELLSVIGTTVAEIL